jgi:hypothetical protein
MGPHHGWRHQAYTNAAPDPERYELLDAAGEDVDPNDDVFKSRMALVGDQLRAAGVTAVYLVHGSFVGEDASGLLSALQHLLPAGTEKLRQQSKRLVDRFVGEHGNYTEPFAQTFESSINRRGERRVPVRLAYWSSENHHIGRADGAVRLFDELCRSGASGRVLLWGHSHAGNVFALLTNLLGGEREAVRTFFEAAAPYFRRTWIGRGQRSHWYLAREQLLDGPCALADARLDFVTFGTPIRYGWNPAGFERLLHVVHHRPQPGKPEYLAAFPSTYENLLNATGGDYVQQLGIAGTNVMPPLWTWRTWWADRRLNRLLQPELSLRDVLARMRLGMRVADAGKTLLVDYGAPAGNLLQHHAGHAVYTERRWLAFHAEQTVNQIYKDV